jgi:hypothetical protein
MRHPRKASPASIWVIRVLSGVLKIPDPLRLRRRDPGCVAVVDVGLAHPGAHRFHAVAECRATRCTVPSSVPSSARKVRTIRTAAAFSSGLYLRVVDSPATVPSAWLHPRSKVRSLHDFQDASQPLAGAVAPGMPARASSRHASG